MLLKKQLAASLIAAMLVSSTAFATETKTDYASSMDSNGNYKSTMTTKDTDDTPENKIVEKHRYVLEDGTEISYTVVKPYHDPELWNEPPAPAWTKDEAAEWYGTLHLDSSAKCPSPWTEDPMEKNMIRAANGWKQVYTEPDRTRTDLSHAYDPMLGRVYHRPELR